ncbi:hypothetical protein WA026_000261 [Henosepilachna vigintioctopunctata]|uniref:Uncharacterized protein n=1 Tax=Henosepilachna vigintioctopunctata TaxID=420089 RepID=A0AAW1V3B0_9CUCU
MSEEILGALIAGREAKSAALWRRIACSVRLYVRRTDTRRHHMAELRRLDAESAIEIADNEERIKRLEDSITKLKHQYNVLVEDNDICLNQLKSDEKQKSKEIIRDRKI